MAADTRLTLDHLTKHFQIFSHDIMQNATREMISSHEKRRVTHSCITARCATKNLSCALLLMALNRCYGFFFFRSSAPISRHWAAFIRGGWKRHLQSNYAWTWTCQYGLIYFCFPSESCTNVFKNPVVSDCSNSYKYSFGFIPYIRQHINLFPVNVPITSSTVHWF